MIDDPLPKPLEEKLAPVIESNDVVAAVFTDLDPSGRFGEGSCVKNDDGLLKRLG